MRIALVFVLAACKSDPGPACDKIVDHMLELTKQQLTGHDTVQVGDRKVMIAFCEKRQMTKPARQCLLDAKSLDDLAKCKQLEGLATPAPTPAPRSDKPTPH